MIAKNRYSCYVSTATGPSQGAQARRGTMGGDFHTNYREENLISRLESSRQSAWSRQLAQLNDNSRELAQRLAMRLVDAGLIETTSVRELEQQLHIGLEELLQAEDFEIQYAISPLRNLVPRPNRMSLWITSFIIERLINHRCVEEIYGTDEEIYQAVNKEVTSIIRG